MKWFWQLLHKYEVFPANHLFQEYHLSIMQTAIYMPYNKNHENTHTSLEEQWTSVPVVLKCSQEGTWISLHLMEFTLQVCSRLYCQANVLPKSTFKPPMALAHRSDTETWIKGGSFTKWCTMSIQHWQSMSLNNSVTKSELHCYRFRNIWFSLCINKFSQVNVYLHLRIFSLASVTNKHRSGPVSSEVLSNQFYSECIALVTKKWFSPGHWNPWVVTIMSTEPA